MHVPAEVVRRAGGQVVLQVTVDGWWEHAQVTPLPLGHDDVARIRAALARPGSAAEVLWRGPPIVFVGARGVDAAGALAAAASAATPQGALDALCAAGTGRPRRAELGAINAWRSVGALEIPLDADERTIAGALRERPQLARCTHPVALELAHDGPRGGWWGCEVSSPDGEHHVVDPRRVAALLDAARA